jgi:hypothetical protein
VRRRRVVVVRRGVVLRLAVVLRAVVRLRVVPELLAALVVRRRVVDRLRVAVPALLLALVVRRLVVDALLRAGICMPPFGFPRFPADYEHPLVLPQFSQR